MVDTEDGINAELAIVCTAITNIMLTGQEYEVGSGPSRRVFKAAGLEKLQQYRVVLENKLKGIQGTSGFLVGF